MNLEKSSECCYGGTAAEQGGGKFVNGVITGAYAMLFNHILHEDDENITYKRGNSNKEFSAVNIISDALEDLTNVMGQVVNEIKSIFPAAVGVGISGDAQGGSGAEMTPIGIVFILQGNPGIYTYTSGTLGLGWCGSSIGVSFTNYYFTGNLETFSIKNIAGEGYSGSISVDAGLSVSGNLGISKLGNGYTISTGTTIGLGVGPTVINGMGGYSVTKIHGRK